MEDAEEEPAPVSPIKRGRVSAAAGNPVTREALYEEVWSEPMTTVAARYGVSGSLLARVCSRLNVPRPPRGYWESNICGPQGHDPHRHSRSLRSQGKFWASLYGFFRLSTNSRGLRTLTSASVKMNRRRLRRALSMRCSALRYSMNASCCRASHAASTTIRTCISDDA